jgi:hypothetical protein
MWMKSVLTRTCRCARSTRVTISNPGSILVDQGRDAGPLVRRLALELVQNACDDYVATGEGETEGRAQGVRVGRRKWMRGMVNIRSLHGRY